MFTWSFAYLLVNGIGIPTWSLLITIFADLWWLTIFADGIVGRLMVALVDRPDDRPDDREATGGYQPRPHPPQRMGPRPKPPGDE